MAPPDLPRRSTLNSDCVGPEYHRTAQYDDADTRKLKRELPADETFQGRVPAVCVSDAFARPNFADVVLGHDFFARTNSRGAMRTVE